MYADSTGNAFTFTAGATSFGTGSGSHTSLADLKIVPGHAVCWPPTPYQPSP